MPLRGLLLFLPLLLKAGSCESERLATVAAFPKMTVKAIDAKAAAMWWSKGKCYFEVRGKPIGKEVLAASSTIGEQTVQERRVVAVRLKDVAGHHVALFDYSFPEVAGEVCNQCRTANRIAILRNGKVMTYTQVAGNAVIDDVTFEDIGDGGPKKLVLSERFGMNAWTGERVSVFDVAGAKFIELFDEILGTDTTNSGFEHGRSTGVVDWERTRASKGKTLVVRTTVYIDKDQKLDPPRVEWIETPRTIPH